MTRIIHRTGDTTISSGSFGNYEEIKVLKQNSTAHWERGYLKGWWEGRFHVEKDGALSIDITETGSKSSKRVMVSLPAEAVAEIVRLSQANQALKE